MSMGDCDRKPCPVADVGQRVRVELDPRRQQRLGVERVEGLVTAVTPFLHGLVVGGFVVGGHRCPDVITKGKP